MLLSASLLAAACLPVPVQISTTPNILIVLLDDIGVDYIEKFGLDIRVQLDADDVNNYKWPNTPKINSLLVYGVKLTQAWTAPTCSPTRSNLYTGRWGLDHGIFVQIFQNGISLSAQETFIADVVRSVGYDTAIFGKWHLQGSPNNPMLATGPTRASAGDGFGYWEGQLFPIVGTNTCDPGTMPPWQGWEEFVVMDDGDADQFTRTDYLISHQVNDVQTWTTQTAVGPWLCVLASQAPFETHQAPPLSNENGTVLHTESEIDNEECKFCGQEGIDITVCYRASIEAFDAEFGELLEALDQKAMDDGFAGWHETTTIFFLGDNGTPKNVVVEPWDTNFGKTDIHENGVHVPLIVAGPGVDMSFHNEAATIDEPIQVADIFPTVASLAGVDLATDFPLLHFDGMDFSSLLDGTATSTRGYAYTENHSKNFETAQTPVLDGGERAFARRVNGKLFKLVHRPALPGKIVPIRPNNGYPVPDSFFNLTALPQETENLLFNSSFTVDEQAALDFFYDTAIPTVLNTANHQ